MVDALRLWRVQLAVSVLGATTVAATLLVALSRIDFASPSVAQIAAACQAWALPHADVASIMVLALGSFGLAATAMTARAVITRVRAGLRFEQHLIVCGPLADRPRAHVVEGDEPHAFCAGLLRPRVYVSRGALDLLADDELAAVLAHEDHHAARRDPLRVLVAGSLADGLFFLPVLRRLADRYAALAELAADRAAVAATGGPHALASALLAFDERPSPAVVGIAPERVDHLLGERARWELPMLLLAGGAATIAALATLTVRTAEATGHASVALPALLADACMVAMAAVPLMLGAAALVGARRFARRRHVRA